MSKAKDLVAKGTSEIVLELPAACSDEARAVEFFEKQRWQGEPWCPHCGCFGPSQMRDRATGERNKRFLWRCSGCKKQFTVKVGTVMEDSRIAYRHWAYAFWAACSSKKGVSALQIKRVTGVNYRSALFLMHRIRFAMADEPGTTRPLAGTVEVDETYIGGKPRKFPNSYGGPRRARGYKGEKQCVVAMVERGGELRPVHAGRSGTVAVHALMLKNIEPSARIMTDESKLYSRIGKRFAGHDTVMHSVYEYARVGADNIVAHTNTAEGFFSLLKRGLYGTFHSVSPKHLHRYLSEFEFRYNQRDANDGERIVAAIRKAAFKRLTYAQQVEG